MALKLTNTTDFDGGTPDQMDEMAQDEVVLIALDDIDESDRLRPVDMDFAQAIASSIEKSGLLQPIDICQLPNQKSKKPYRLVAGGHRMEAHRILGHTSIPCFIRSNDADQRRAREIAENLFKADLKPFERAKFVGELVEIEKRRAGIGLHDDGRKIAPEATWKSTAKAEVKSRCAIIAHRFNWSDKVGDKLGLSRRSIYLDLQLLRIPESIILRLKGRDILENAAQLKLLSACTIEKMADFCAALENGETTRDALAFIRDVKPLPKPGDDEVVAAFFQKWRKLSTLQQDNFLGQLQGNLIRWDIVRKGATK